MYQITTEPADDLITKHRIFGGTESSSLQTKIPVMEMTLSKGKD